MIKSVDEAIRIIKNTNQNKTIKYPYFFIVGAGISVPEIPAARDIIEQCKNEAKKRDKSGYIDFSKNLDSKEISTMDEYSSWIDFVYPNRIDRSNWFRKLNDKSKISSANLLLSQILDSRIIANTVFTTNFDDSIKRALELIGAKNYFISENAMDNLVVNTSTEDIQVVHVHGTYNFYDCANLKEEIHTVANQSECVSSSYVLSHFLSQQAPIVIGYSGWEDDVIMQNIKARLKYPTPLNYIWFCYSRDSYEQLPEWLKASDDVIFVVNEAYDTDQSDYSIENYSELENNCTNDATKILKRLISGLGIPSPLIFNNPYSYYSKKIIDLLPQDEDVLHLKNWARQLGEHNDNNEYDQILGSLEKHYIKRDYKAASEEIRNLSKIALESSQIGFLCNCILQDFVSAVDDLAEKEQNDFNDSVIGFIERNIESIHKKEVLIPLLNTMLSKNDDDSMNNTEINRIVDLSAKYNELLEIQLRGWGIISEQLDNNEKRQKLDDIIEKIPNDTDNRNLIYILFITLLNRALCEDDESIIQSSVVRAESLYSEKNNTKRQYQLIIAKIHLLYCVENKEIKKKWETDIHKYIDKCSSLENKRIAVEILNLYMSFKISTEDEIDTKRISKLFEKVLLSYNMIEQNPTVIIDYTRCTYYASLVEQNIEKVLFYEKKALALLPLFLEKSKDYDYWIMNIALKYIEHDETLVSQGEKIELITSLRKNQNGAYYYVLNDVYEKELIPHDKLNIFLDDKQEYDRCDEKFTFAMNAYFEGNHLETGKFFTELSKCGIPSIEESAKKNMLYMIRRGEIRNASTFWELYDQIEDHDEMSYINTILYCRDNGEEDRKEYVDAMQFIKTANDEQRKNILEWWDEKEVVGEKEHLMVKEILDATIS